MFADISELSVRSAFGNHKLREFSDEALNAQKHFYLQYNPQISTVIGVLHYLFTYISFIKMLLRTSCFAGMT